MAYDLSILIPARNEQWLARTVHDIFTNATTRVEVVVVLDGERAEVPQSRSGLVIIDRHESVGQRGATNDAARIARAPVIMKIDAHSAFSHGFDRKILAACAFPDWVVSPAMRILDVATWTPKPNSLVIGWYLDKDCVFRHWETYSRRPEASRRPIEIMAPWGGCWAMHRDRFFLLGGLDERFGNIGGVAEELACKTWLSGGKVICEPGAWCAHLFRGNAERPYHPTKLKAEAEAFRSTWQNDYWLGQIHPLSWLVERFRPVPTWHSETDRPTPRPDVPERAAIVYYTSNTLDPAIMAACQRQLDAARGSMPVISVSLKPISFGGIRIIKDWDPSYLSLYRQIVAGIESSTAKWIFLAEHDVLYSAEHFAFRPVREDCYWYNASRWMLNAQTGENRSYYGIKALSHLCGHRELLLRHFRERVARIEREGIRWLNTATCEPGVKAPPEGIDFTPAAIWRTARPNVDIRMHGNNWGSRMQQIAWTGGDEIPGWGMTKGRFREFMEAAPWQGV